MGTGAPSAELRRHLRLAVELKARRRLGPSFLDERVLNVSTGGLALATPVKLTPGNVEQLVLRSPDGAVEATVQAEVVRVHGTPKEGAYIAGLRFTLLDAQAAEQLEQLMLSALAAPSGQRQCPRLEVRHEVFWSAAGFKTVAPLELLNVSHTGALMHGDITPAPGTLGLLSLRADQADELLAVPGQVVWRRSVEGGQLCGVRFGLDPSATQLVRRILKTLLFHHPHAASELSTSTPGTRIGEFELLPLEFRGHTLEIYRAKVLAPSAATGFASEVMLKRFCGGAADVGLWTGRFLEAARLGQKLYHHPGVVRVYSVMADSHESWLATERVDGTSLEQKLAARARAGGRLPVAEVVSIARDVLTTLEDCHSYLLDDDGAALQVLHGDIRPSNVLVMADGAARLQGFGAPFELRPERLAWLPPEVLDGGVATMRSDVYQVGVLLYEALTSVLPFPADSARRLRSAMTDGAPPPSRLNSHVPKALDALVLSALAVRPDARPWAGALAESLSAVDLVAAVTQPSLGLDFKTEPSFRRVDKIQRWSPAVGPLGPGSTVGRYRLVGKLAEGGMAELFVAKGSSSARPVVLKTILPSRAKETEVVTLFMNEARLVSQIDHPNVIRIVDVGFDRQSPFIAMEYFASRTLVDVMLALQHRKEALPIDVAAYVLVECCAGLDCAHGQRDGAGKPLHIVHRDVSSKNILVGYGGRVKVVDFGIARSAGMASFTNPGHVRGTAAFVAPEQVNGSPVSPATDVWSLGVNLYLMLTGQLPFKASTDFELLKLVTGTEPLGVRRLRTDVPEALNEVLQKALAKSPLERYASAADLRAAALPFVPDVEGARAKVAALMESLFPEATDSERKRARSLAPEDGAAADVPRPRDEAAPAPARKHHSPLKVMLLASVAGAAAAAIVLALIGWLRT